MSRLRAVLFVFLLVGVGSATLAGLAVAGGPDLDAPDRADLVGVNFVSHCDTSHHSMDDPIVFPGQAGRSHDHTFVGATTTNAWSTLRKLQRSPTTCEREGHTAAYWMPSLLVGGQTVLPRGATIYYRRRTIEPVRAFPPGLKMIAGDAKAMEAQPQRVTFWNCGVASGIPPSSTVPTCPNARANGLRLHVMFPSCWNGTSLDSADHQSHMAYPRAARCPITHPVSVPAIALIYRYPVTGGPDTELASMGQLTAHADFFNAWDQQVLTSLVDGCLNALRHCGRGS